MRLVFFGSGAFGLPTLEALAKGHEVELIVTQPDRPAGRRMQMTRTVIAAFASLRNIPAIQPENVNDPTVVQRIRSLEADAFVVIAFGQKLGTALLQNVFAINLHASLLPKYRGAAPINWAIINGEEETGVSVIALADRMDAGDVFAMIRTDILPTETAGDLHDRLAQLGPKAVLDVLTKRQAGKAAGVEQDHSQATMAPKLSRLDGTTRFDMPAAHVRNRIHGLTPWPGCVVRVDGAELRVVRTEVVEATTSRGRAGEVLANRTIACGEGCGVLRFIEVQPPGRPGMTWRAYLNGHTVSIGSTVEAIA